MLCSNRTSSCDFLAERPSRAGRLSELRFRLVEKSCGKFADSNRNMARAPVSHGIDRWPRHLPAPSPPIPHFCDTLPDRENTGYPLGQRFNLCRRSRSSRHLLALRHSARPWCLDCFHPVPDSFVHREHTGARGRYLDIDYCTISPCSARSRPSRSTSCVTRRPTAILTTKRMIKLATAS